MKMALLAIFCFYRKPMYRNKQNQFQFHQQTSHTHTHTHMQCCRLHVDEISKLPELYPKGLLKHPTRQAVCCRPYKNHRVSGSGHFRMEKRLPAEGTALWQVFRDCVWGWDYDNWRFVYAKNIWQSCHCGDLGWPIW